MRRRANRRVVLSAIATHALNQTCAMRLLTTLLIATLSLATVACGGTSSTSTTSSAAQGRQAGEAFVCLYRQGGKTAPVLVQDYQMWVSGEVTVANAASLDRTHACGKPPTGPLSGAALQGARAVVRHYAESIRTWSPQEVTYLHKNGL
jgi:hypothetical protein